MKWNDQYNIEYSITGYLLIFIIFEYRAVYLYLTVRLKKYFACIFNLFLHFCSVLIFLQFFKKYTCYVRVGAKEGWLKFVLQNGHALVVLSSLNDVATSKFQGPTSCVVSWKPWHVNALWLVANCRVSRARHRLACTILVCFGLNYPMIISMVHIKL